MGNISKIVYFDENSATDYVQIIEGGNLEKTTRLLEQNETGSDLGADGKISVGISGMFSALIGFGAKSNLTSKISTSINTVEMAENILKNTILTDFLSIISEDKKQVVKEFKNYTLSILKDSLSYIIMVSPYMTMLNSRGIQTGDFNIAVDKIDNAVKSGKGYYEFIGEKEKDKIVLRFNINAFKNNYRISDILKMELKLYAIKVGKIDLEQLNFNNELNLNSKSNPDYDSDNAIEKGLLDVYDVILAGVAYND